MLAVVVLWPWLLLVNWSVDQLTYAGDYELVLVGHQVALSVLHVVVTVLVLAVLVGWAAWHSSGAGMYTVLWPAVLGLAWAVSIFDSEMWWGVLDAAEGASLCAVLFFCVAAHWWQFGAWHSMWWLGGTALLVAWHLAVGPFVVNIVHWWTPWLGQFGWVAVPAGGLAAWLLSCWHVEDVLLADVSAGGSLRSSVLFVVVFLPYAGGLLGASADLPAQAVAAAVAVLPVGEAVWPGVLAVLAALASVAWWPLW